MRHIIIFTPWFLSCSIFLPTAESLESIWLPESFMDFRYLPIWVLLRSFKNMSVSLLLLRSKYLTKDFDNLSSIFLPSVLFKFKFTADTSLTWVPILLAYSKLFKTSVDLELTIFCPIFVLFLEAIVREVERLSYKILFYDLEKLDSTNEVSWATELFYVENS